MINTVILTGRLVSDPELIENLETGKKGCIITVAVNRQYKNLEGIYETDFIKCVIWNPMADNVKEYCLKGDLIGIKGRLECLNEELKVVAEKITFLASRGNN